MQDQVRKLIEKWETSRAFADAVGLEKQSHVRTMKVRGRIPRAYWYPLVADAQRKNFKNVTLQYLEKIHAGIGERRS